MSPHPERPAGRLAAVTPPVAVLLGLQFLSGSAITPSTTFLPVYLSGLGHSAVAISLIVLAGRLVALASTFAGGALCDRLGHKRIIVLGQLGILAGLTIFLTPSAWPAALLWGLSGSGAMLVSIGGQSLLMRQVEPRSLGVLTALYYWGYTLGGSLSSPAAGFLLGRAGYPAMAAGLGAAAAAAVLLGAARLPRTGTPPPERPPAGRAAPAGRLAPLRAPGLHLLGMLRLLPTFLYGLLLVFIPLLLKEGGAATGTIALYAAVSSIGAALCQLAIGRIADTRGPRAPTLLAFALLIAGAAALAARPSSPAMVFAAGTAGVAAAWSLSTLLPVLLARITEPADYSRAMGTVHLFWNAGMIASSLVGGFLFEAGRGLPFAVGAILNLAALALVPLFFRLPARR